MNKHLITFSMFFLIGCGQGKDGLKEKAAIESSAAADSAILAQNNNLNQKVTEMESDLDRRQRFYEAISGNYIGTMTYEDNQEINVRFVITQSITRYKSDRIRTLEEVESDLSGLYVNVHVSQWNSKRSFASACIFEKIRPDLENGKMELVSSNCNYSYSLAITTADTPYSKTALIDSEQSAAIAADVRNGKLQAVGGLVGERRSSTRGSILGLSVKRMTEALVPDEGNWTAISDEDTAIRLSEMEADLEMRHRFYESIAGIYEGSMTYLANRQAGIRFVFSPSLPRVQSNRQRTISEVESDLMNLNLNVQVVQWDKYYSYSTGCSFESIKPDFASGKIQLISPSCANMYSLEFSELDTASSRTPAEVALSIKQGTLDQVLSFKGTRSSSTRAEISSMIITRVGDISNTSIPELTNIDEPTAIRIFEMEADLAKRQRFFQAVSGIYEGEYSKDIGMYATRITIIPSIVPYTAKRLRMPEEIANDIENLSFNIQMIQWNPKTPSDAGGCRVEGIKPNLLTGEILISKESCQSLFTIALSDGNSKDLNSDSKSKEIADKVLEGKMDQVSALVGRKQTTVNALFYDFSAKRVK